MHRDHLVLFLILLLAFIGSIHSQDVSSRALSLDQCIQQALHNNPGLHVAKYQVRESQTRTKEARSAWYPTLDFSSVARQYPIEDNPGSSYNAGLTAYYVLFNGYQRTHDIQAARAGFHAEKKRFQSNRDDLVYQVTEAYYSLWQAVELVRVTKQSLARAQLHLEYAETRFETGLATRSDTLKAQVEVSSAQLDLTTARNGQKTAAGRLNVLMGEPAQQAIRIKGASEEMSLSNTADSLNSTRLVDRLTALAFRHRPDLKMVDYQLRAQKANLGVARSTFFPTLALETNYSSSGTTLKGLKQTSPSYVGLNLSLPLFTGFRNSALVQRESLVLKELQQERQQVRDQVGEEVWNGYLAVHEARERIANTRLLYNNADENLRVAEGEYKEGTSSMLNLIDAQTALTNAEERRIAAFRDYHIALAELQKVTGTENVKEMFE